MTTGAEVVLSTPIGDDTTTYRRDLPHLSRHGKPYFVTFGTYLRLVLPNDARDLALASILHDHMSLYTLHAVVIMPDHVHALLTPSEDHERNMPRLCDILQRIKSASAHRIKKVTGIRRVWQHESFDHILRSDESTRRKAEYIVANPVRKGLATSPDDWPWKWRWWIEGTASEGARRHTSGS